MTGSVVSASNNPESVFVVAPNWLGDGIMAMPALQLLKQNLPEGSTVEVVCKPGQYSLWGMNPHVDEFSAFPDISFVKKAAMRVWHHEQFTRAYILPNSFRSAWIPARLQIPHRRGTAFQFGRKMLITDPVSLHDLADRHQQWEMARILLGDPLPEVLPYPELQAPERALESCTPLLAPLPRPLLGLIPGAARGPSKQWPGERFQSVARSWITETGGSVCWMGTPADTGLCEQLNAPLGDRGLVLAGKTDLQEFAGSLALSDVVLANDSGGMHLAAALGTPVVGIFGITDPARTGPLSPRATVLQHSEHRNRKVPRDCPEAREALAAVTAAEASEAVLAFL